MTFELFYVCKLKGFDKIEFSDISAQLLSDLLYNDTCLVYVYKNIKLTKLLQQLKYK